MLYTKEQVEMMLELARTTTTPTDEIMDMMTPVYLVDEDSINDTGYDEVGPDNMDYFKQGGEWVNSIMERRMMVANEDMERIDA